MAKVSAGQVYCNAVLIKSNWLLTSASCYQQMETEDAKLVVWKRDYWTHETVKKNTEKIPIVHPDFNWGNEIYDFALLELDEAWDRAPICLPH